MNKEHKILKINIDNTYDAVIFGKLCKEVNFNYLGLKEKRPGGSLVYATSTCASCLNKVAIVPKLSSSDKVMLESLYGRHVDLFPIYDEFSQEIRNHIYEDDLGNDYLLSYCYTQSAPFHVNDIPNLNTYYYIFPKGVYGDYDVDLIKECSLQGKVALDASTFLNYINEETHILEFRDHHLIKDLCPYCDILKISHDECLKVTNADSIENACKILKSWGANEILVVNGKNLFLMDINDNFISENIPCNLNLNYTYIDTVCLVAYATARITSDPIFSLYNACVVGMSKIHRPGTVTCSRTELDYFTKFLYSFKPVVTIEPVEDNEN